MALGGTSRNTSLIILASSGEEGLRLAGLALRVEDVGQRIEQRLVVGREAVPGALREDEDLGNDEVAGQGVDLADQVVVLRQQRRRVVLGARPVLERRR